MQQFSPPQPDRTLRLEAPPLPTALGCILGITVVLGLFLLLGGFSMLVFGGLGLGAVYLVLGLLMVPFGLLGFLLRTTVEVDGEAGEVRVYRHLLLHDWRRTYPTDVYAHIEVRHTRPVRNARPGFGYWAVFLRGDPEFMQLGVYDSDIEARATAEKVSELLGLPLKEPGETSV